MSVPKHTEFTQPVAALPKSFLDQSPEFRQHVQQLIDSTADPERATQYFIEFAHRHPAKFNALHEDPERLQWLATVFSFSRFLSEELLRRPEALFAVTDIHRPLSLFEYKKRLAGFLPGGALAAAMALDLALFRRRELLRLVIRDGLRLGSLSEITAEISNLADAILGCALEHVTSEVAERHGLPHISDQRGDVCGFCVISLGKLGGCELNYSSDLDLMFLYAANGETSGPDKVSNKQFFQKVANQLTNLLSTYTPAGLCYRIDLRLRPEGSLGDVCISLAAAKEYYARRARDWELQMLIKARAAAGDEQICQALLDFVEPSIYSTSVDFSTVETMSGTRERIGEKLARKRSRQDELDIKLARGGIRDIEFLVQCLQRLHGAREPWVRHGGTLLALSRLLDKDLLSATEHSRLADAYLFLRHLEHRLQFEDDRQTHSLPTDAHELERIARRMPSGRIGLTNGISASAQLLQEINQHLENVQIIYDRIVHAQRPLYYSPHAAAFSATDAPVKTSLEHSDSISARILQSLEEMAPALAESFRVRSFRAGTRISNFFEQLLKDRRYVDLLDSQPVATGYLQDIFELSPFLSEQLTRYPELIEELCRLAEHPARRWAFEGLAAPLSDIDGLRRFFRREMFRIQAASICVAEPVFQTLDRTSALVEFVVARAYRVALEKALTHARAHATRAAPFQEPASEMMVVALGRLGMREFDVGSDADLLFIIPDAESLSQQFWTRVAEHLIDILTAYTGEGAILSLDTRLRPNGREGMLVQSESKYVEYFSKTAEAWEGIAYMKARGVAGDIDRATAFLTELQQVDWRRYGQGGRSKQDLRQMRMRLQREQGAMTPLKAGEGGYYDADFILMYLRLKGAGMFFKSLNTPERIDVVEKMGHLERADAEFLLEATTFFRALDHGLRILSGRAEQKLPSSLPEQQMLAELVQRWTGQQLNAQDLAARLQQLESKMRHLFDRIFAP